MQNFINLGKLPIITEEQPANIYGFKGFEDKNKYLDWFRCQFEKYNDKYRETGKMIHAEKAGKYCKLYKDESKKHLEYLKNSAISEWAENRESLLSESKKLELEGNAEQALKKLKEADKEFLKILEIYNSKYFK